MGEAREVFDKITQAFDDHDLEAAIALYSPSVIAVTPDQGTLQGRDALREYFRVLLEAFPDTRYENEYKHESGNTAIDEGHYLGTHTGPLPTATGDTVPPTNRQIRVRVCDIGTVENGLVTSHRFYFDQVEFLSQLGLMPEPAG